MGGRGAGGGVNDPTAETHKNIKVFHVLRLWYNWPRGSMLCEDGHMSVRVCVGGEGVCVSFVMRDGKGVHVSEGGRAGAGGGGVGGGGGGKGPNTRGPGGAAVCKYFECRGPALKTTHLRLAGQA